MHPSNKSISPSHSLAKNARKSCEEKNIKYHNGKVWTTDAVYRETPTRINNFSSRGAICVDMEATACFATAEYRRVDLAAIFYGGDLIQVSGRILEKEKVLNKKKFKKNYLT